MTESEFEHRVKKKTSVLHKSTNNAECVGIFEMQIEMSKRETETNRNTTASDATTNNNEAYRKWSECERHNMNELLLFKCGLDNTDLCV